MAWYWPELETPQSAKTAVVNAVGVSALLALLPFIWLPRAFEISPRGQRGRLRVTLGISALFAVIGWGIRRMSRIAAIAGALVWFVRIALQLPSLVFLLFTYAYPLTAIEFGLKLIFLHPLAAIGFGLKLLVLLLYIIAVRATFVYHDFKALHV